MSKEFEQIIMRSEFDEDIYHLGYRWKLSTGKRATRLACTIHIDDIEGMFGEDAYLKVEEMNPGSWEFLT